jgi:uncharacterized protein DUF937/PRC-barrel domain protein
MANIVSAISSFLTPEVVGQIASTSGLSPAMTQTAVGAAVPSILSALANAVARPGGASKLATAVAAQPTDLLGNIVGTTQMATQGGSLLSSLLGGGVSSVLASTVGKFLGIGEGTAQTVIGLLTPVIMGVLGREQRSNNLDANGLARMLTDQRGQIVAAMPAGLANLLDNSRGATERSSYEAPRAQQRVVSDTKRGASNWLYWVLPLLALGGLLWAFLPRGHEPVRTSQPASAPSQVVTGTERQPVYYRRALDGWTVSIGSAAHEYVNQNIYNRAGERLGTIKDILKGPDDKMVAAVVSVGRTLGIGDKDVAVSFPALQSEQRDNQRRIVIDATRDTLQAAPAFER